MLAHFTHRSIFPFVLHLQIRMSEYCIPEQRQRRLIRQLPCFQKRSDLTKNKWVPPRCTSDHNAITPCLFQYRSSRSTVCNISIPDDRNRNRLFDLPDDLPVCLARIILLSCPPMHGDRSNTACFCDLCDLYRIDMCFIKALTDLDRYRLLDRLYGFGQDFFHQLRIFHQGRAFSAYESSRTETDFYVKFKASSQNVLSQNSVFPCLLYCRSQPFHGNRIFCSYIYITFICTNGISCNCHCF